MTPDEHYREAERLVVANYETMKLIDQMGQDRRLASDSQITVALRIAGIGLARAQVHATLATLGERTP